MKVEFFDYEEVTSTNDVVFEKLRIQTENEPKLFVVTAKNQTKGRGRNNKIWYGNTNENLYYSCAFRHSVTTFPLYIVQMLGGLAAYNLLSEFFSERLVRLKYPNDIYVVTDIEKIGSNNCNQQIAKKVVGIIAEHNYYNSYCESLIGIGINNKQKIFPAAISYTATSLINMGFNISNEELKFKLTDKILALLEMDYQDVFCM